MTKDFNMPIDSTLYSAEKISAAATVISPFVHRTPVLSSSAINELAACEIFFKCENFQKVGAFKMRGASYAIQKLSEKQKQFGVITHSSGNHAQAVALAAKLLNLKAYIVMPNNAPKVKVAAVESYGGVIRFCEANIDSRQRTVDEIMSQTNAFFIPPFDHVDIIIGQATCAKELIEEKEDLDMLICPVGGGGLLGGTILSAHFFGKNIPVYAGEPEGASDAYESLKTGKRLNNLTTNTIADGLLTPLGKLNYELIKDGVNQILLVNDLEIKAAMQLIWERMKIIVEPSAAVPLASILKNKALFKGKKIGLILSGGNVDLNSFFSRI